MSVRLATHEDLPKVLDLLKSFAKEGLFAREPNEHFVRFWESALGNIGTIFIAGDYDAVLGALLVPEPLDGVMTACEMFWFSRPELRGRAALEVFAAFEEWASENSERTVVFHFNHMQADRLARFYTKRGYKSLQTQYAKGDFVP